VTQEEQRDLDKLGIAKNAREEKMRARDAKARGAQKNDAAYDARMAALYREVVLKEKPAASENGFIPLGALAKTKPLTTENTEVHREDTEMAEPVSGD
jgi:hypothetical protein